MKKLEIRLSVFEKPGKPRNPTAVMEFHILRDVRDRYGLDRALFSLTGNVVLANFRQVRDLAAKLNANNPTHPVKA
ncbi:MAG: hypothetical protein LBG73_00870, partial [Spirochaetaceae bacterium]|nr:hypothetical protein [Spirochaetaceae bacterium]